MSIKLRLMGGFLGIALLVGITGVIAVLKQLQTAEQTAIIEARELSEIIDLTVSQGEEDLQSFITYLHVTQQRDIEVVDLNKLIIADAVLEDVGTTHDAGNEVGLTLQDGQVRTFVETSEEYPQRIRKLVAPLKTQEGEIIGGIIVEYTALYERLRSAAEATGRTIAFYTFACVILALALGYFVSNSISGPILKLRDAAVQIEQGQLDVPFPSVGRDEIGQLVASFAHMTGQLRQTLIDLEQRVSERTVELSVSEARFRDLFEHAPISIWEEDFSAVRQYIDDLRTEGIVDFSAYFDAHPEAVTESAARVKIVDVNLATLKLFQAESKTQLLADLSKVLGPESLVPFKEELLALVRGETSFENETTNYTLSGERRAIFMRLTVAPGSEQTWNKVYVGISDITERREAEAALTVERDLLQALMDNIPDTIYFKDADSRFIRINRAQVSVLGVAAAEDVIGKTDSDFFQNAGLVQSFHDEEQRIIETGQALINRIEFNPTPDGKPRWFSATKVPIKNAEGNVIGIVGVSRDITERNQVEESLRQSEERFRLMSWATKDAVWDWDLQTHKILWGAGLQKIFQYSSETTETDSEWWRERIHPDDRAKVDRVISQAVDGGMEFWSKEYRFQRVDGTYADIMDRAYIIRDAAGKAYRMVGAMMDITERKYMESSLQQSNEKMGEFLNELQERNRESALLNEMSHRLQVCQTTQDAYLIIADLANQMFPHTAGALYLLNAEDTQVSAISSWGAISLASHMFTSDNCKALRRSPTRPLNAGQPENCCLHSAQSPAITYCLPIQVQGKTVGIFHLQSISEENLPENKRRLAYTVVEQSEMALSNLKLREALLEQSTRDPLTELYNRRYMEEALNQQLSRVTRQLHPLGLIMIDIDHFKNFNDTHGHAAGDALLRELGRLLQSHIRGGDVACRYGGEEFLLIMPDASLETAHQRARQLQQEAKKLRVQDDGQSLDGITLSLGVAIYPEHGRSIDSVLRAADAALYRAKQEGRDRVVVAERAY